MIRLRIVALGLTGMLVSALAHGAEPATRIVAEADSGSSIELCQGDLLEARLKGNPSTGYAWEYQADPKMLANEGTRCEMDAKHPMMVGGGGTNVTAFRVLEPGTTQLKAVYRRAGDKELPPARIFVVNLTAKSCK